MAEDINKALEDLAEYISNAKQVDLWLIQEADRKKLYDDIKGFFYKEKDRLELKLVYEVGVNNHKSKDRFSYYDFKKGTEVDVLESKESPAVRITDYQKNDLMKKAYFLLHQLKESLGIELSIKNN